MDPVYDNSDLDDDGVIDNPGSILYYKDVRTGQKDSNNWNFGFSASITIPLDGGIQERKSAMDTQTRIQMQILRNKELDWNLARLRHCGELADITFAKHSKMYDLCRHRCGHAEHSGAGSHPQDGFLNRSRTARIARFRIRR